ncbi:MAG: SIMPL domain-containing protein [Rhizobiaceae bacterium]
MIRPSLIALAVSLALPVIASAQVPPPAPRVMVTGEGEAAVRPDLAMISLTVMREAATAREALTANNDAMAAVIAAMKASGVAERDLQTAGIQINPRYSYDNKPDGTQVATLVAYQVSNTISIRVRDLSRTGEIIDQAVSLGVNQGGSIVFSTEDPSAILTEARKRAVADAIEKARTLAEAAGVSLGKVVEISELAYSRDPQPYLAKAIPEDAAVPVESGENSYRVQVNVTFELD